MKTKKIMYFDEGKDTPYRVDEILFPKDAPVHPMFISMGVEVDTIKIIEPKRKEKWNGSKVFKKL